MLLLWSAMAFAQEWSIQNTREIAASCDEVVSDSTGDFVAFLDASQGQVHLLSYIDWSVATISACVSTAGGLAFDSTGDLFVACDTEGVVVLSAAKEYLPESEVIAVDATSFLTMAADDESIYILADNPSGGNPRIHRVDIATKAETTTNFPTVLGNGSGVDMEFSGNFLVVSHGGSSLSKVDPITGSATRDQFGPTTGTLSDVLPEESATNAMIAAGTGGVMRFLYASNEKQFGAVGADLIDVTALASTTSELWVADAGSDSVKSFTYAVGSSTMGDEILEEVVLDSDAEVVEMAFLNEHLILGSSTGQMIIVGQGPWVEGSTPSPSAVAAGDSYTVSFVSSQAGSFTLRLGATNDTDGSVIGSGTISAGASQAITLMSDGSYVEGKNPIRILVASEDGTGHDTVYITVDNPPTTPTLTNANVGYGNQKITVDFSGITDEDVSHYIIYVSEEAFTSSDFTTGGPDFEQISEQERTVNASAGEDVRITLTGLSNDVLYYVAVRAYDAGGMESDLSNVIEITPRQTQSASGLAGETGGFCGMNSKSNALGLLLSIGFLGLRRRSVGLALVALFVPGIANATTQLNDSSLAEEKVKNIVQHTDVRYGTLSFASEAINNVFTVSNHQALYIDTGMSFRHMLDISAGAGFIQEMGWLLGTDGTPSDEHDMLTILPLNVSATARLDFWDQQMLVPFASAGLDYWIWRENWVENEEEVSVSGGKMGYHYAFGGQILLDRLDESAASKLELKYGIEDTYLSVEYRQQEFEDDGLSFNSSSTTFGIRFHY